MITIARGADWSLGRRQRKRGTGSLGAWESLSRPESQDMEKGEISVRSGDDSDEIYGRRFPKGIRLLEIALVGISHSTITGAGNGKLHINCFECSSTFSKEFNLRQ